jgi:ATP-binding cassette subfamily C protein CydD
MNRRLLHELRLVALPLGLNLGLAATQAVIVLYQASLLSQIIQRVFITRSTLADVAPALGLLSVVIGLRAITHLVSNLSASEMAIRVKADLRRRLLAHLMLLGPAYTRTERSGQLTVTATEGIEALDAFYRGFVPGLIGAVLIPLIILVVVFPIDVLTFGVLLATAPLIPLFMALIGSAAGGLARRQFAQLRRLGAHFLDIFQGLVTLKLFNRSQAQTQSIAHMTDQFRQATMRVLRVSFLSAFMLEMLSTLSIAIVAVEISLRLLHGGIGFEQALFLLIIAPEFYMPLRTLGARFHAAASSAAAAVEIYRVLDQPLQRTQVSGGVAVPTLMKVRFDAVTFAYEHGARPALNSVTLDIQPGQKVALVGVSGGGKSTCAHLLLRFVTPDAGRITVDGVDLSTLDADQWRERVAWVPQAPYLFNTTIAGNIRLGKPAATQAQIVQAAQAAGAHEFICQLPRGYDTPCGERGARLSGGQAQRIAIARAVLKDAPLLILDEATASLDEETEAIIQVALRRLMTGRTALIIAHRLNTIRDADRIYVLDDGQVVEQGAHAELMAQHGNYCQLIQAFDGRQP